MRTRLFTALAIALMGTTSNAALAQTVTTYQYDALGRVVNTTGIGGSTTYAYDKAGNRTTLAMGLNHAPLTANDTGTVSPGSMITVGALSNDSDPDSNPLTITGITGASKGTAAIVNSGTGVSYTANSGASGTDTLIYTVSDSNGAIAAGKITITINGAQAPPTVAPATTTITANTSNNPLSTSITGSATSVAVTSAPANGSTSISGTTIYYTPSSNWSGVSTLSYTASNAGGTSSPAQLTVQVKPTVSPVSNVAVTYNTAKSIALAPITNYSALSVAGSPSKGAVTISGATATYTPNSGQTGADSFSYRATTDSVAGDPQTVSLTISSACQIPVASTASATVAYNSASNVIPLNLSGGAPTSVNYVTGSSHGSVQAVGATMYYSPFSGYSGADSFTYNATNACGTSNTATGNITVSPPPNRSPVVGPDSASIAANSYAYFDPRTNDSDPDGDPLTLVSVTTPQHGSSWTNSNNYISYVPTAGWSGTDGFSYTISDGRGGTATGAVNVYVAPPPVNHAPTANPGTTDPVWQSTTTWIYPLANDTDPDGDPLTIQSIDSFYFAYGRINGVDLSSAPASIGSVTNNGSYISYSPPFLTSSGTTGSSYIAVVVWYTVSDGRGGTSQSYQIIDVYGPS